LVCLDVGEGMSSASSSSQMSRLAH